jgi:hypothetical protein
MKLPDYALENRIREHYQRYKNGEDPDESLGSLYLSIRELVTLIIRKRFKLDSQEEESVAHQVASTIIERILMKRFKDVFAWTRYLTIYTKGFLPYKKESMWIDYSPEMNLVFLTLEEIEESGESVSDAPSPLDLYIEKESLFKLSCLLYRYITNSLPIHGTKLKSLCCYLVLLSIVDNSIRIKHLKPIGLQLNACRASIIREEVLKDLFDKLPVEITDDTIF